MNSTTLLALLTGFDSPSPASNREMTHFGFWNDLLFDFLNPGLVEVAIFLPGILNTADEFKADFRRFSVVGQSPEHQIRNCFELGFEKGFDKVVLIRDDWKEATTALIQEAITAPATKKITFFPAQDGSLACWAMQKKVFWDWPVFDATLKNIVVEMISICIDKNIDYQLIK